MPARQFRWSDALFFVLSLIFALGAFSIYVSSGSGRKKRGKKRRGFQFSVRVQPVKRGEFNETIRLMGDLLPRRSVTLRSEIAGKVSRVYAREGVKLRKGQRILSLDSRDQRLQLRRQRALLAQAKASLVRAQAVYARDLDQYKRSRRLRRSRTISERALFQARYAKEASFGALSEIQALISLRKVDADIAQRDLARTVIRAPFPCRVSRLHVEIGKHINKSDSIVDIVDAEGIEVRLYVPPAYISRISPKMPLSLRLFNQGGPWHRTQIRRLRPVADSTTRNQEAIALLSSPPKSFLPGLPVEALVIVGKRKDVLLVKKDALIRFGKGWVVYKVAKGKAIQIPVTLLNESKGMAAVAGRMSAGDPVVTVGNEALFPYAPVSLRDPFAKRSRRKRKR